MPCRDSITWARRGRDRSIRPSASATLKPRRLSCRRPRMSRRRRVAPGLRSVAAALAVRCILSPAKCDSVNADGASSRRSALRYIFQRLRTPRLQRKATAEHTNQKQQPQGYQPQQMRAVGQRPRPASERDTRGCAGEVQRVVGCVVGSETAEKAARAVHCTAHDLHTEVQGDVA